MAIFRAYFDESGTDEASRIIVVGGAVGKVSSWHLICEDWESVLSRHNVKGFHSSDYNTRHGEYKDWDDEHRHRFIDDLFDIMENRDVRGMAYVMEKRDYEEAVKVYSNMQMSPYKFLAYACAIQTGRLTKIEKNMSPIEVVFEAGQPFYSHAMGELLNDLGLESTQEEVGISTITVQRKSGVIPFQVADLIIYELFKAHLRLIDQKPSEPRYQARKLNKIMRGFAPKLSPDMIQSFLSAINGLGGLPRNKEQ